MTSYYKMKFIKYAKKLIFKATLFIKGNSIANLILKLYIQDYTI